MTTAISNRMVTARQLLEDAAVLQRLSPESRFEYAIDAAYVAALEVAVHNGFVLRPTDADMHPLEGAVRAALTVLPVTAQDKHLWPRYMDVLRNRYFQPLQEPPATFEDVQAWAARAVAAAEQWLAQH